MNIRIISFTDRGRGVSQTLAAALSAHTVQQYAKADGFLPYASVRTFAQEAMQQADAVVFVGAAGIAVRAIAPFVRSKDTDPAVLVIDENGKFVISLLSGHIGGANAWTRQLADILHAIPVVTTATDGRGVFAADSWAVQHGCAVKDIRAIQYISGALLRGEQVGLRSDFPIAGALPDGVQTDTAHDCGILLSVREPERLPFAHTLHAVPRVVHVGVGCKKQTDPCALRTWTEGILRALRIVPQAVASVSSIDLKREEPAVLALAQAWRVPVYFYSAQQLEQVTGDFPRSDFVRRITGTDNVCQRAAAKASENGSCLLAKTAKDGMTVSIYAKEWRAEF
ncbi:cobalt-precorrin 5A hydrolase [Butyricicoccus sp.]|uniref:cobalt-precorrin 5A hydrolase n=1 Tax=Butyricicoccus sp. TaxID=2049021 RepID=UPI003AAACC72